MTAQSPTERNSGSRFVLNLDDFNRLAHLLMGRTRLHFPVEKRKEFEQKLIQRVPLTQQKSGAEFVTAVESSKKVFQEVIDVLTVGESYFFRNKPHFDALREQIFPTLFENAKHQKRLRIWCAGCASGEEPYSLSILLREQFPEYSDWDVSIVASDINTSFLSRAEEGVYSKWSFRGVPDSLVFKYFSKEKNDQFRLHADVKRNIDFRQFNLADILESKHVSAEPFDLILCRNVLIYFSFKSANEVISSFAEMMRKGSFLVVGHSEAFPALSQFEVVYSHATYYYKFRSTTSTSSSHTPFSYGPSPSLLIPGIGVQTMVPKTPFGHSAPPLTPNSIKPRPRGESFPEGSQQHIQSKSSFLRTHKRPVNLTAELERARMGVNEGKTQKTLERLNALARGAGKLDYRVHFLCAILLDQAGNVKEAIKSLKQSIFLNKNFIIGHFYLAVIHEREGDLASGTRYFRNALNLVSRLPEDHLLDEAEGLTAGRLREIVEARFSEIEIHRDRMGT